MKSVSQLDHFQALDACHQQIHAHLAVFLELCHDHIVREETLIYPAAKAKLNG